MLRSPARALLLLAALAGCRPAEIPEADVARRTRRVYEDQIAGLEKLVARAERGEPVFGPDQLAVGIDENAVRDLLEAALPLKVKVGAELTVEVHKVEVHFRWAEASVMLESRASSTRFPGAFVAVKLQGGLDDVTIDHGRLSARVGLVDAELQGDSLGTLGKDLVDRTLKRHLADIEVAIPPLEVPVRLEQGIAIAGLGKGPVSVPPGNLPLTMSVASLIAGDRRLWVMLDVTAGPWQRAAEPPPARPAAGAKR
ncbi:MAG: hypothetical protein NDJ94_14090 [Vicinamibacteria bacterium]|nr:hypothetical protein [Vicinamibacteria bacterium]